MADHSLVIDSQGEVWAWGDNREGQLGLDEQANLHEGAVSVPTLTQLNDVEAVAYGALHSLVIRLVGEVWAWGYNETGQLGLGDNESRITPTLIPTLHDVTGIACGEYHSLAIDSRGRVWSWGSNNEGQLGLGNFKWKNTPTLIPNLPRAVTITCGHHHSLMIDELGNGWAWGRNSDGQLGLGLTTQKVNEPRRITSVVNLVSLAAAENSSLFLDNQGQVWRADHSSPNQTVTLIPELQLIVAISTGSTHSLALDEQGQLWSWGYNTVGQVGFGQVGNSYSPTILKKNIKDMICGFYHSLALDDDDQLWAWGDNSHGQLGLGDANNRLTTPTLVEGLPSDLAPYYLRKYRRGVNIKNANS